MYTTRTLQVVNTMHKQETEQDKSHPLKDRSEHCDFQVPIRYGSHCVHTEDMGPLLLAGGLKIVNRAGAEVDTLHLPHLHIAVVMVAWRDVLEAPPMWEGEVI